MALGITAQAETPNISFIEEACSVELSYDHISAVF